MSDYYTTANYGSMLRDRRRIDGYLEALRKVIVPGETRVLELGTGTGIVAFAAAKAGAKRVYAVEPNSAIAVARQIAKLNELADNIEFIQAMSTEIDLEPCDVIISDMRGGTPLFEFHIPSIVDARERLLKPDAAMIARADDIYAAPVTAGERWKEYVGHWDDNPLGIDMSPAKRLTANSTFHFSSDPENLLAEAGKIAHVDYHTVETPNVEAELEFTISRDAEFHGFSVWFDSTLDDDIVLSNAPGNPLLAYGRPLFPVESPFEVREGERLVANFTAKLVMGSYVWRWRGGIEGDSSREFAHSTFESVDVSTRDLELYRADSTPSPSVRGERARFVLKLMDGHHTLQSLAESLAAADPNVASVEEAITFVTKVVAEYGTLR